MNRTKKGLGPCPECGQSVMEREHFYGCDGWREGCGFTLSKGALASLGHANLSPKQVRKLLKGPVQLRFRMANGTERLFWVELKNEDGRWRPWVDFDRGAEAETLGRCPLCGAEVVEYPLSFGCTRWEDGCEFAIFKNSIKRFGGKMLSAQKARELLTRGETEVTITGRDKRPRKVKALLDREFGCKIDLTGDQK